MRKDVILTNDILSFLVIFSYSFSYIDNFWQCAEKVEFGGIKKSTFQKKWNSCVSEKGVGYHNII